MHPWNQPTGCPHYARSVAVWGVQRFGAHPITRGIHPQAKPFAVEACCRGASVVLLVAGTRAQYPVLSDVPSWVNGQVGSPGQRLVSGRGLVLLGPGAQLLIYRARTIPEQGRKATRPLSAWGSTRHHSTYLNDSVFIDICRRCLSSDSR